MRFQSNQTADPRPVHERVIAAIADGKSVDATALDPLYETVDPEALDALFKPGVTGRVEFTYEGHDVAVGSDGHVSVDGSEVDAGSDPILGTQDDASGVGATRQ